MWHSTPDRIALTQMLLLLKVELLVSAGLFVYVFFLYVVFFFPVEWNYFSKKKEEGQKINFYYPAATDND